MEDIINRSENGNEEQNEKTNTGALDFSFKMDGTNEHLLNSTNRSRSLNTSNKSRSLKRKHPNDNIDNGGTISMPPTRIFHADAFCGICRKVEIFFFFLNNISYFSFRNFAINIF
jgi:hypothetical protein